MCLLLLAGAALLGLTPEGRTLQRMVTRFQTQPPVTLMHNMSAYHVLPALTGAPLCLPCVGHQSCAVLLCMAAAAKRAGGEILADAGAMRETAAGLRGESAKLTVRSHPLPLTEAESVELDSILLVLAALFVLVPFCLLSGGCWRRLANGLACISCLPILRVAPSAIWQQASAGDLQHAVSSAPAGHNSCKVNHHLC